MARHAADRPPGFLTDPEVEAFRALAREHAGAALTPDEVQSVAGQLLRVLLIIRDTARGGSTDSTGSVDGEVLPESTVRGEDTPLSA